MYGHGFCMCGNGVHEHGLLFITQKEYRLQQITLAWEIKEMTGCKQIGHFQKLSD